MNLTLKTGFVVVALALAPLAAHAADKGPAPIERAKEIIDDATVTSKIKAAFARDKAVSALNINVDTNKGVVTLSGTARSKGEADKAAAIAKDSAGVSSVKNEIRVTGNK